ncbi:MAG TPA: glycine oxidase ThiO [Acidimicrobiales bacterium]|nr:glycine oxidase ThiO [Acidimicrobiales bacterium]
MTADVIVVGGGVVGLSSAWLAAGQGLAVTVLDPAPGRGASWVAAGMLAPVTEATFGEEALVGLLVAAAERWPAFAAALADATGADVGYRPCGTVAVAVDADDRAVLDQMLAFQQSLRLPAERLLASDCRRLVPALSPGIRGGVHVPGDHQVDNRRLLPALLAACRRAGVTVVQQRADAVVVGPDGAAAGVELADGTRLVAGTVLVAPGVDLGGLGGVPDGVLPPVHPVKGHVVRLRGPADRPLLDRTVRGLVHGRPCYLVPRDDGTVVVGATSEDRGFDRTVQAGAVHGLLDDARTLVPGIDELELVEALAGLRPGSPDNAPFVGRTALPRLLLAAGHYRNGILLAPLTADAVTALLDGRPVPPALAPFGPDRAVPGRPVPVPDRPAPDRPVPGRPVPGRPGAARVAR